jgi:hypothetical protein
MFGGDDDLLDISDTASPNNDDRPAVRHCIPNLRSTPPSIGTSPRIDGLCGSPHTVRCLAPSST